MDPKHHEAPASIPAIIAAQAGPFQPDHVLTYNGNSIRVAKVQGGFVWHSHSETDELFYVVSGGPLELEIANKETNNEKDGFGVVTMNPGDMYMVPSGRRHRPSAENEVHIICMDKAGTTNTGDAGDTDEGRKLTWKIDEARAYNAR